MVRNVLLTKIARSLRSVALASLFTAVSALGQVDQGRFVGHVADPQGSAVVNAAISATNLDTNITQTAKTDENGDYVITSVVAGNYTVKVAAQGFEGAVTQRIEVQVAQIVRQDFSLKIGSTSETAQVALTGLPGGVQVTYASSDTNPSGSLTFSATSSAMTGNYMPTVIVMSAGSTATTRFMLDVQSP